MTLGSVFSKTRSKTGSATLRSVDSEENLARPSSRDGSHGGAGGGSGGMGMMMSRMDAITVTREVSVSYSANDKPFVHAALVGLVQGEIASGHMRMR